MRTAAAAGQRAYGKRNGYSRRPQGRSLHGLSADRALGAIGRTGPRDGLVEIWNGMPFFSPLWARGPKIVFLHHVHAEMWRMVLPPKLAKLGETIEFKAAPPFYRSSQIVTLSRSSRDEIIDLLGLPEHNVTVVPPGIDPVYRPGGARSPHPLVVAVGRLVPVKRPGELVAALLETKKAVPALEAVLVGEGYEREGLETQIRAAGAQDWLRLPGRVSDAELVAALPARLGAHLRLGARGLGHDAHRGRGLRHARLSSPTSPATVIPRNRASAGCSSRRRPTSRRP